MRFISARVATSTIHATVHEKTPVIASEPGHNVLAVAFLNMWRNFVSLLTMSIELMGVVIPIVGLAWVLVAVWKRWNSRIRAETPNPVG